MVQSFNIRVWVYFMLGLMKGAGDAEVDVIYISFIVSVQHIRYLWTTGQQPDNN